MHAPQEIYFQAALCVLANLNYALGCGLLCLQHGHLCVEAHSDSSCACDRGHQKSISGYYTFIGRNLVTWRSKKQHVVSLFSGKAEYHAIMHASSEMLWIHYFFKSLVFQYKVSCPCIVITKQQSFLPTILLFMNVPSISRLISMLFGIKYLTSSSPLLLLALPIN